MRSTPLSQPARRGTALLALAATVLAGCGAPTEESASDSSAAGETVDNCGTTVDITTPPERVVTMNQHATEVMLALGLEDRLVGTAYLDDEVLPEFRDGYSEIPVLAERYPTFEELIAAEPDLVYAGYPASAFDETEGRSRQALADAGVATYANIEQCSAPVTMDTVATEIRTVGRIFDVPDRADELVAEMRATVDSVEERLDGSDPVDVLVVDSIDSSILTAGGHGIGTEIIRLAGGRNVFADVADTFADVSIEQAADRSPEAIVVYDYGETSVEDKREAVLADPTLAGAPAVEERRFAVLPLSSVVVGVRVDDAVVDLAEQLHPDAF